MNASDSQDWIGSPFKAAELNGQPVEYRLLGEDGHFYAGEGRLIAIQDGNRLRVSIKFYQEETCDGVTIRTFIIPGSDASLLVQNPPCSKTPFSFKPLQVGGLYASP